VAHALVRAVSRLVSTRQRGRNTPSQPGVATSGNAARTSACATSLQQNREKCWLGRPLVMALLLAARVAQAQLPDGPGKEETLRLCSQCHELERSVAPRQDREGWQGTVEKMVRLGAKGSDKEFAVVIDYLATSFPGETIPKLNVNAAKAIEFESRLSLKRSEAAAVIAYREKHGSFKSVEDLKKVPGIDAAKVEAKKDRLTFEISGAK